MIIDQQHHQPSTTALQNSKRIHDSVVKVVPNQERLEDRSESTWNTAPDDYSTTELKKETDTTPPPTPVSSSPTNCTMTKLRTSLVAGVPPGPIKKKLSLMARLRKSFSRRDVTAIPEVEPVVVEPSQKLDSPRVHFGTIHVREYPIAIGSGGVTRFGAPIGIDWDHVSESSVSVDEHERIKNAKVRRKQHELLLMSEHRALLLSRQGFTMRSVVAASKECVLIRKRRASTVQRYEMQQFFRYILFKVGISSKKKSITTTTPATQL